MAKASKTTAPEFPKPLVRLVPSVGGYAAEVRMVADRDGETAATAEGFQAVEVPARGPAFAEYPKWQYHPDGRAVIVQNEDEAGKLDGFDDAPPAPEKSETAKAEAPKEASHRRADRG